MKKDELKDMLREIVAESHSEVKQELNKLNGFGKFYKFLRSDFGFLSGLLFFIIAVVTPFFTIKNDIGDLGDLVKGLQTSLTEIKTDINGMKEKDGALSEDVAKINGFLSSLGIKTKP